MHTKHQTRDGCRGRSGSAFIVVIMLTGILMIAGASLTYLTSNAAFTSRKINNGARALAIAEAGVADMLSKISTNYIYWVNGRSNSASFAEGAYSVTTERFPNANVLITSTGTVGGESRTTILELLGVFVFDGCIVAGGDVTLRNPAAVYGDVHANGDVLGGVSPGTVEGNISAAGTVEFDPSGTDPDTGAPYEKQEGTFPVSLPDIVGAQTNPIPMMPIDGWRVMAQSNGIYMASSFTFSGEDLAPSNGVMFVEGDVTIGQRSSLVGTLVASGSIHINNQFDQTAFLPGWPCFIAGQDIREDNQNTYQGTLFCGGDYVSQNNRMTVGMIIAMNNVTIENRGVLYPPTNAAAVPPEIRYGGWLQ